MWKRLQHPNIVPFLGVPTNVPPPFQIVCDWMENGRITEYVRKNPEVDRVDLVSRPVSTVTISPECYISQLWDVADGLHFLHSNKIIHGDLKGVSHPILHSQFFSESDINLDELEGERSDRQGLPRPSHGFWADIHHSGGGFEFGS